MIQVFLTISIVLLPFLSYAENSKIPSTETICNVMKLSSEEMQSELPIPVDYATDFITYHAHMNLDKCEINMGWRVDVDDVVQDMVKESNGMLTRQSSLNFLKSEEGEQILKTTFEDLVKSNTADSKSMATLKYFPNVRVTFTIRFDDVSIKPIKITHIDTTKRSSKLKTTENSSPTPIFGINMGDKLCKTKPCQNESVIVDYRFNDKYFIIKPKKPSPLFTKYKVYASDHQGVCSISATSEIKYFSEKKNSQNIEAFMTNLEAILDKKYINNQKIHLKSNFQEQLKNTQTYNFLRQMIAHHAEVAQVKASGTLTEFLQKSKSTGSDEEKMAFFDKVVAGSLQEYRDSQRLTFTDSALSFFSSKPKVKNKKYYENRLADFRNRPNMLPYSNSQLGSYVYNAWGENNLNQIDSIEIVFRFINGTGELKGLLPYKVELVYQFNNYSDCEQEHQRKLNTQKAQEESVF